MPSSSETTTANPTRELAAIVFSDIAGYTALMGRDERAAVRALAGHRDLVRSLVPRFNGKMIGDIGDGALASFHSALDAVHYAQAMQAALVGDGTPTVRIGIHVGDVLFSESGVMGDGVNVASRIHALAPPGGICISERVYDDVCNKPEIQVRDLGQKTLKNVVRPIRVYMLEHAGGLSRRPWEPRNGRSVFAVGFAAVALSILAIGAYAYRDAIRSALAPRLVEAGKPTVAVLPFANLSGSKDDEYFSDGISDEVRGDLTKIAGLQVIARTSSYAFKGQNEDVRKIARLLSVRNLLEGSVRRSTDRVRIEVELIDATSGFSLWSETYDREMADVFTIQSDIAQGVANKLRVTLLPGEKARVERKPTDNLEAYNLYLRGLSYLTSTAGSGTGGGAQKTIDSFSAAIAKDPNFAAAYVGRATAYGLAGFFTLHQRESVPKVKADVERALALNDTIGQAHAILALVVYFLYQWDWPAAEREFQVALKLNPDDPTIHFEYGYYLSALGRFDDSLREKLRARELDPQNPILVGQTGDTFFNARKYDQALQYYQQQMAMAPNLSWPYFMRGWTLLKLRGDRAAFVRDEEKAVAMADVPPNQSALAYAYTLAGRSDEARRILRQKFEQASKRQYVDPGYFALTYFALGDKDRAFELLDQAYQDRSALMVNLNLPYNDPMRSDPRYTALVKKVGLPP
jgi:TolB-like protein/class 3 adenylate cyclase/tetratricopeptide (TPR) repeat protein